MLESTCQYLENIFVRELGEKEKEIDYLVLISMYSHILVHTVMY